MLNVGPLELLVVLAVALIVVGPERLPELARSVGKALRQLRQVQDEVRDMVAMGVDDEMRQAASDFKKATGDLARAGDVGGTARKAGRTVRSEARKTITPSAGRPGAGSVRPVEAPKPGQAEEGSADPTDAQVEGAGPPADRLVEDGATAPDEASAAERSDGPAAQP